MHSFKKVWADTLMVYKVAFEHLSKNQPKALSVTRHLSSEQNIYNVSILKSKSQN